MFDSFSSKVSTRVAPNQKVADKQKEQEPKRPFVIWWKQTSATINQTIQIEATVNIVIKNPALININIMYNNKEKVGSATNIVVGKDKITAEWTVRPRNAGLYTEGAYHAKITYSGGVPGETAAPLKIVSSRNNADTFIR
jgi:hypothetical protein